VPAFDRADLCAGEFADGCDLSVGESAHAIGGLGCGGYKARASFFGAIRTPAALEP
jgi:hypothetical protein